MRILFTRFPYESVRGGAERQTQWLASHLKERGHVVSFLGDCEPLAILFKEIGVVTEKLSIGLPPVTPWLAISFLWRKERMREKLINSLGSLSHMPDVLVMLSLTEKILLTEWAHTKGIKVLWIEHDRIGRWLMKNPWLKALLRASSFATIICVSKMSKEIMINLGFDTKNVIAIPNGVPFPLSIARPLVHLSSSNSDFSLPRSSSPDLCFRGGKDPAKKLGVMLVPPAGKKKALHVGVIARLSPEKGIDVLLHATSDIPDVTLTIVGIGREEGYVRSLIIEDVQRIGIERVKLVPSVDDLEKFYQSLDILVLPSRHHDPFGLVAAEAMARGVATIITDVCGIASYLEHGKDVVISKAGSSKSLGSSIQLLLDEKVRTKIAEEGKTSARILFSLSAMADAYEKAMKTTE